MTKPAVHNWLLCYDIADPRRLQRIHRYMKDHGWPLQYSVFQLRMSNQELEQMIQGLEQLIDPKQDDIRIYPLHKRPRKVTMGKSLYPRGVWLFDNHQDLLGDG